MAIRCLTLLFLSFAFGTALAGTAGASSRQHATIPPATTPAGEHSRLSAPQQVAAQQTATADAAIQQKHSLKNNETTFNFKGLMAGSWALILGIFALFVLAESREEATKALLGSALGAAASMGLAFIFKYFGFIHF